MNRRPERSDYIADAEAHNGWWDGKTEDLERVARLPFRSDVHKLVDNISEWKDQGIESAVGAYAGQKGIGKTTLFKQTIGVVIRGPPDSTAGNEGEQRITGTVEPTQVLYIPIEESLYNLEKPETALHELRNVIDYFRSHVAQAHKQKYIFIDDLGALNAEGNAAEGLLNAVDDRTYLFVASGLTTDVDFDTESVKQVHFDSRYPISLRSTKFVDYVKMNADDAFATSIEAAQTSGITHPSKGGQPIKAVRSAFDNATDELVSSLNALYFDYFDAQERGTLHDLSKSYLRDGGLLYKPDLEFQDGFGTDMDAVRTIDEMVNDLIRANLQITLLKEVGPAKKISEPRNLIRLASYAARKSPPKYRYKDLADILGVDRRTVDTYLDALEEAMILTQSQDYSIIRHREARLYLRDPRYVILLSQRADHEGFEQFDRPFKRQPTRNQSFERTLALSVAFDHAYRLSYPIRRGEEVGDDQQVEYHEVGGKPVDYIIHDGETVFPFVLDYQPQTGYATEVAAAFDPTVGAHQTDSEPHYRAPYRFVITDQPDPHRGGDSLTTETNGKTVVTIPFWLFLLIC